MEDIYEIAMGRYRKGLVAPDPEDLARFMSKQTHALETQEYDGSYGGG